VGAILDIGLPPNFRFAVLFSGTDGVPLLEKDAVEQRIVLCDYETDRIVYRSPAAACGSLSALPARVEELAPRP